MSNEQTCVNSDDASVDAVNSTCVIISAHFLDPEGGSQKATLIVLLVLLLVISSLKILRLS